MMARDSSLLPRALLKFMWTSALSSLFCSLVFAEQASDLQTERHSQYSDITIGAAATVSSVALVIILVVVLYNCGDCYNSEVSSDFHPATGQTEVKWGGAGGYSAAATSDVNDRVLGAGFTGQVVVPGQGSDQALPYTMIPTQVPEAQGFAGYGSAPPPQGVAGYGGTGGGYNGGGGVAGYSGGGRGGGNFPGAHVMPGPDDPPPSYFSST